MWMVSYLFFKCMRVNFVKSFIKKAKSFFSCYEISTPCMQLYVKAVFQGKKDNNKNKKKQERCQKQEEEDTSIGIHAWIKVACQDRFFKGGLSDWLNGRNKPATPQLFPFAFASDLPCRQRQRHHIISSFCQKT